MLRLDEWCVDGVDSLHGIHVHIGAARRFCVWHIRASSVGMPHASQERSAEIIYAFGIDKYNKTDACSGLVALFETARALHTLSGDDVCGVGVAPVSGTLTFAIGFPVYFSELVTRGGCEEHASRLIYL